MIRYTSTEQLPLSGFQTPFEANLDPRNRWVKLSAVIPWDELAQAYYEGFDQSNGRPAKDARLVIGAVILKHKLCLSDEETIEQIRENLYFQYFVGLKMFQPQAIFTPSLFVLIRKRMGEQVFQVFEKSIIAAVNQELSSKDQPEDEAPPNGSATKDNTVADQSEPAAPPHQGKLIVDATVAEQSIRFPTDLGLLNEAREISEQLIDVLYPQSKRKTKPRTYRHQARKAYLAIAKRRKAGKKVYRRGRKQQLQYLRRNLGHIEALLNESPKDVMSFSKRQLKQYWVIQTVNDQQNQMHKTKSQRCDDRIVSLSQAHVRPIVRGKLNKAVEFGSKLSVSLTGDKIACVDALRWDAFHEGLDLEAQVQAYKERHGYYPEKVLADPLYGTRENRRYLKDKGIHFAGKPLGRPKKQTEQNKDQLKAEKKQRHQDYTQRIPIEGKFGQGKSAYGLGRIKAKTAKTSEAWIRSIFFVMNLLVLMEVFRLRRILGRILGVTAPYLQQEYLQRLGRSVWRDLRLDRDRSPLGF